MLSPEFRRNSRDIGLLIFRVGVAALMIAGHGYPKWANLGKLTQEFGDPIGLGTAMSAYLAMGAEFFCSILVILGLATRIASIPVVVTMIVAAFVANAGAPLGQRELALVYGLSFFLLVMTGPGRLSLDGVISFLRRDD